MESPVDVPSPATLDVSLHRSTRPANLPALSRALFEHRRSQSPSPRACDRNGHRDLFLHLPEELVIYLLRFLDGKDLCRVRSLCRNVGWREFRALRQRREGSARGM